MAKKIFWFICLGEVEFLNMSYLHDLLGFIFELNFQKRKTLQVTANPQKASSDLF